MACVGWGLEGTPSESHRATAMVIQWCGSAPIEAVCVGAGGVTVGTHVHNSNPAEMMRAVTGGAAGVRPLATVREGCLTAGEAMNAS